MKTKQVILTNDFHQTEYTASARRCASGLVLSKYQVKKAKRVLCGIEGCTCGDGAGCRPSQVMVTQDGEGLIENGGGVKYGNTNA